MPSGIPRDLLGKLDAHDQTSAILAVRDLKTRVLEALLSSTVIRDSFHHSSPDSLIATAEVLWQWVAEIPQQFAVYGTDPFEQGQEPPSMHNILTTNGKDGHMADINLTDSQQVNVAVQPLDAKGNPVTDALTWTIDDPTVAGITVSADGYSVEVVANKPGTTALHVTDGTLSSALGVTVVGGSASSLSTTVGTPQDQPAATASDPSTGDASVTTDPAPQPGSQSVVPGPGAADTTATDTTPAQVS